MGICAQRNLFAFPLLSATIPIPLSTYLTGCCGYGFLCVTLLSPQRGPRRRNEQRLDGNGTCRFETGVTRVFKCPLLFPVRESSPRWVLQERLFVVSLARRAQRRGFACRLPGYLVLTWVRFLAFFFSTLRSFVFLSRSGINLTSPWSWCSTCDVDQGALFRADWDATEGGNKETARRGSFPAAWSSRKKLQR